MIKQAGPMKLHMKWFSVLNQQLEPTQSQFLFDVTLHLRREAKLTIASATLPH